MDLTIPEEKAMSPCQNLFFLGRGLGPILAPCLFPTSGDIIDIFIFSLRFTLKFPINIIIILSELVITKK